MFVEILFILLALMVAEYLWKKKRNDMTSKLRGPKTLPLIGSSIELITRNSDTILEYDRAAQQKYGDLYKVWFLTRMVIFCSDPKYLETVLSSPKYIHKGSLYKLLTAWLGDSLLISSGAKWHQRRKIITPTFHFKILEKFVDVFDQQSAILIKQLKPHCDDGNVFNIQPYICLETLDIIAETAMGTKLNAQTEKGSEYVNAVADISKIIGERFVNIWMHDELLFTILWWNKKQRQEKALKILHDFSGKIIENRRKILTESLASNKSTEEDDEIGSKKRMAFLDVLLQSTVNGQPLSNIDIQEEVDTFIFEGHDTTTSGISSALYALSRNPQIQKRTFEEIRNILGEDKDRPICLRELQELKYLENVIKETLRMYPPVPIFSRLLEEDVDLGDGQYLPAGTGFHINIDSMQHDPKYFPEPGVFNPDRFANDSKEKQHAFANIPFSAGPRNCIGQKFAMLEMKSTISKILRHYELLPLGPQMKPQINIILRTADGVHLGLSPRKY